MLVNSRQANLLRNQESHKKYQGVFRLINLFYHLHFKSLAHHKAIKIIGLLILAHVGL